MSNLHTLLMHKVQQKMMMHNVFLNSHLQPATKLEVIYLTVLPIIKHPTIPYSTCIIAPTAENGHPPGK